MKRKWLALLLFPALFCMPGQAPRLQAQTGQASPPAKTQPPSGALAAQRLSHLRHGINLSSWFAQVFDPKGYTEEHFLTHTTPEDIALIHAMGFDHVRLSINPQPMFREGEADAIPKDYLAHLDEAVNNILANGLAVILDIHPESDFKRRLALGRLCREILLLLAGVRQPLCNPQPGLGVLRDSE